MSTAIIKAERSDGRYVWSGTMLSKTACRPIIDNDPSITSQCHPVPTFMVNSVAGAGRPPSLFAVAGVRYASLVTMLTFVVLDWPSTCDHHMKAIVKKQLVFNGRH